MESKTEISHVEQHARESLQHHHHYASEGIAVKSAHLYRGKMKMGSIVLSPFR